MKLIQQGVLLLLLTLSVNAWAHTLIFKVQGADPVLEENINARLKTEIQSRTQYLNAAEADDLYQHGIEIINKAIQPYGYFHASIKPLYLEKQKQDWVGYFNIDLGQPMLITQVSIQLLGQGSDNAALLKFVNHLPLRVNDRLQTPVYEKAKADLLDKAQEKGFLKANYADSQIKIDVKRNMAAIILKLDTGPRYYFGKIRYDTRFYSPDFLRQIQFFKPHEHFSNQRLQAFQQEMDSAGYFKQVDVVPQIDEAQAYHVPLDVTLLPPKSRVYNIGVGYGTFTGPRLIGKISFPRVTNTGHYFNMDIKLSSVLSSVSAKYFIPGSNPLRDKYVLGAGYQTFSPKNGKSESGNLMLGYLTKVGHWRFNANLNYLIEHYEVLNLPSERRHFIYPSVGFNYIKTDSLINPSYGRMFNMNLQGAAEKIFSSTDFMQAKTQAKYLFSPTTNSRVIVRGEFGYTVVNRLKDLPLTLRYFTGGINSIRAFPDSSIGPGRYLYDASAEYRYRVWKELYAATFYDVGTATNQFGTPLNTGVGVGAVYQSIVGPIRVYLARAISKDDKPYNVEFTVGSEF